MMPDDACHSYERWRRQWLCGDNSNAIEAVQVHGLLGALLAISNAAGRTRPSAPADSTPVEESLVYSDVVLAEAASQVRRLLKTSCESGVNNLPTVRTAQRHHHV